MRPRNFFAVGTNMDAGHLRRLVPGALRLTVARLPGYTVRWHKRAGSEGKLAAFRTSDAGDAAWGVVYQLGPADFQLVDDAQRQARYVANLVSVTTTTAMRTRPRSTSRKPTRSTTP